MSDHSTSLLLNIITQLGELQGSVGRINAQLEAGAERHREFQQKLDIIDHRTDIIENKVIDAERILTPAAGPTLIDRVVKLEMFMGKVGAIISGVALVMWGVIWVLYTTVSWLWTNGSHLWDSLRALLRH